MKSVCGGDGVASNKLIRFVVTVDEEAYRALVKYQVDNKLTRDNALKAILKGQCVGPSPVPVPVPEPSPNTYDVDVRVVGSTVQVKAGSRVLAIVPVGSDMSWVFKSAVDAVPPNGTLGVGPGTFEMSAPYQFALNANNSNIFWSALPIIDKSFHIYGAGVGKTVLKLKAGQRNDGRHVAMMLVRGSGPMGRGYSGFTVSNLTIDGNRNNQAVSSTCYDGEALVLVGSERTGGYFYNLELRYSCGAGLYLGNNGSGPCANERVQNVSVVDCVGQGIMLDTNKDSKVVGCRAVRCGEGLVLNGNDDFMTRANDVVSVDGFVTDSQVTVWQVNDFVINNFDMDCRAARQSYGFVVRDGCGAINNSKLVNDVGKTNSMGGATYVYGDSKLLIRKCELEGWFGVHAIGKASVEIEGSTLKAPGGCYAMTDVDPVESIIITRGCTCSGKKLEIQEGANLIEE